jgi:uncharacterized protein (TIGR02266 family)
MSRKKDEAEVATRVIDRGTGTADVVINASAPGSAPPEPTSDTDRRAQPRFDVSVTVTLFGDHNFYLGLSENISEGGLFVRTQNILPIGSTIRIEFSLPTSAVPLSLAGEVRWVRSPNACHPEHENFGSGGDDSIKPGMGIQFQQVSPETARAIARFMKHRQPDFYEG